eukprot:m.26351 g.26351  ORF g.26351 m.26351 type:complete len:145 (+) comp29262_c0_seq1:737-1171(+)
MFLSPDLKDPALADKDVRERKLSELGTFIRTIKKKKPEPTNRLMEAAKEHYDKSMVSAEAESKQWDQKVAEAKSESEKLQLEILKMKKETEEMKYSWSALILQGMKVTAAYSAFKSESGTQASRSRPSWADVDRIAEQGGAYKH